MKRRIPVALCAVLFCMINLRAYTVRPIQATTSEIVTAIHQDPMNFIWFGGSNGLSRYDGYSTVCFHDDQTEDRIGYINGVYAGANGDEFLLATKDGLYRYDYKIGTSSSVCDDLRGVEVRAYMLSPDGMAYLATDKGVYVLTPDYEVAAVLDKRSGLGSNHVNVVCMDRDGNLLVGHRMGIDIIERNAGGSTDRIVRHYATDGDVRIILLDMNDDLWYNVNNQIYRSRRAEWMKDPVRSSRIISGNLECVTALDRRDQIWIGTRGGGVLRYAIHKGEEPQRLSSLFLNNSDRSEINNSVVSLFCDAVGDVWIGTMNGVYLYSDADNSFNRLQHDPNNSNTPSIDIISSIHIDEDDVVWLGTSYGINRLEWDAEKVNHTITKYVDHSGTDDFVGNNRILMMAPCGNGKFLISTKLSLKLFDTVSGEFISTPELDDVYAKHGMRYVRSYCMDHAGRIYMAFDQGGIGMWDPVRGVVPIAWNGHAQDTYRAIVRDSSGRLWVGADGRGVWCLTLSADRSSVASARQYDRSCFGSQHVTALHIDSARRIWAGTFSGLYMMDGSGEFTAVDTFGPPFYVSSITEDLAHNIWVSSIKGVYKIASRDVVNYFEIDTLGDIAKLWYIIGHGIDSDGTIYLGGISGLIYFNPNAVGVPVRPTATWLSGMSVDGRPDMAMAQALNSGVNVRLPAGTGSITVEFTSLNYMDPNAARYAYKLDGLSGDYVRVDAYHRNMTYADLAPGDYVLRVKAATPAGDSYGDETCFSFTVERSAAMRWWAMLIYIAVIMAIIYAVWRIVMRRVRRNRENRMYRLKILNFVSINNKLRVPLTSLQAPVEHLIARYEESGDDEARDMLDVMRKNIRRMSDQIDDFIEFSSSDAADSRLHLQQIEIGQLLSGVFNSLAERAAMRGLGYDMVLDDADVKLFVDVPKLEVAMFNLLSCSIGASPEKGMIQLHGCIDRRHNAYVVAITDGSSIHTMSRDIYTCRDLFHIAVAKDFVEMHHSRFRIKRVPDGEGTVYEIRLPLGLSHYSGDQLEALDMSASPSTYAICRNSSDTGIHESGEHSDCHDASDHTIVGVVGMDADLFRMLGLELSGNYALRAVALNVEMVSHLKRLAPGCVIIDAPDIGVVQEFVTQLRRDAVLSGIPVVVVSANSDASFEHACYAEGVALWMRHPIDLRYLHTRIDNLIATHRKIEEVVTRKLIVNPKEVNVLTSNEIFLANVMEVIERNIGNERFTVDMLAADLNISNSVLYRRLKQLTDLSPVNFIRSVRLKRAAQLLRTGRYLVSEVCQMVGFSDQRYFSSCFKRQYGLTPKAWSMQAGRE